MNTIEELQQVVTNLQEHADQLSQLASDLNTTSVWHKAKDIEEIVIPRLQSIIDRMKAQEDDGPWTPNYDGRLIQSEDFNHDVTLHVSGDFATDEDRIAYTQWLSAKLNAAPPVPEGMVLVPKEPTADMIVAGNRAMGSAHSALHTVRGCYKAMIAAAEEPYSASLSGGRRPSA